MRRRELLAGLAGVAAVGVGGASILDGGSSSRVAPVTVTGIDAPGSRGEQLTVPERGRVTFVEVFATWCSVCKASMEPLADAHDRVGDDVQFVSVSNEPLGHAVSRDELRRWWVAHDGDWQLAADEGLALTEALDATGIPTVVVLDEQNRVTWAATGRHSAATIVEHIEAAAGGEA